ncbi:slipin family protein [Brucepastera parasyntrophica]|uniref:slipin family protein n=1 Tax=Brucepastera parasyntrophica TaxID=2880008 RepID=UPI00210C7B5D|nr:slipin family protein [Brucepastera parasyntrophica]ULQ59498.1 slipin family protein [Brucepastera parasyntrophica]
MEPQKKNNDKPRIKDSKYTKRRSDFSINAAGIILFILFISFSVIVLLLTGALPPLIDFGLLLGVPVAALLLMVLFSRWAAAIKICIIAACVLAVCAVPQLALTLLFAAAAVLIAPSIQKMEEWERAIVLRFGRFHRIQGPGLFFLIPVADRVAKIVDLRIRVTDFSAQETLTRDSVTVTVDAICFWLVWDPEKAVCEVQNYEEAVILSSKTALRNAISSHDLSTFLERGDVIEKQIRTDVDGKTTEWGITVQHIEITDIQIPEHLQDSLSRLAQAEREKNSRILLAEAEIQIANRLEEAVKIYSKNEPAMKLKILSILNEGLKAGNSMMLVPNSITEELQANDIFGLQALSELKKEKEKKGEQE